MDLGVEGPHPQARVHDQEVEGGAVDAAGAPLALDVHARELGDAAVERVVHVQLWLVALPPQDEEPVARGHGLDRPKEAGVEAEAPGRAVAAVAGRGGDAEEAGEGEAGVDRGAEGVAAEGAEAWAVDAAAEGLAGGGAAVDRCGVVRVRGDLQLEVCREASRRLRRRCHRRPVAYVS